MKVLLKILIPFLVLFASCMNPMDSDFSNHRGLQDDEMLWVMQIPADSVMTNFTINYEESKRLKLHNRLLFEQVIPLMFKDIMSGDLVAYEKYGTFADDLNQTILNEKLHNLKSSKTDFSALLFKAELFSIVATTSASYRHVPKFLRLIAVDTTGKQPSQPFAGAFFDDLNRVNYSINYPSGISISLRQFLEREDFYFLPSYIRSNSMEYIIESGEQANYIKQLVKGGDWTSIEWVEGQINVSGKKKLIVDDLSGLAFTGSYRPSSLDSTKGELPELFLTAEKDYLVADWSNRFRVRKIFPFKERGYFSSGGELYLFRESNDSLVELTFITTGDTIEMVGESDWINPF